MASRFIFALLLAYQSHKVGISQDLNAIFFNDNLRPDPKSPVLSFGDNGISFDKIFSEINATIVEQITIWTTGNVTIDDTDLPAMPKLEQLRIFQKFRPVTIPLTITANTFRKMPNLRQLSLRGFYKIENSTFEAVDELKNRLENLEIVYGSPIQPLLEVVAKFSKLTKIYIQCNWNQNSMFPVAYMRDMEVDWGKIEKIDNDMFRGMSNLESLRLWSCNITTIESGAFDELVNLRVLDLRGNNIKTLPSELFKYTRKLGYLNVDLSGNEVENLSADNFTCCNAMDRFRKSSFSLVAVSVLGALVLNR